MQIEAKLKKKRKKVFVEGPIDPQFIANSIAKHQTKTTIGAHNIFLGQVRNDCIGDKEVVAIAYTAYLEMAEKELDRIREEAFEKFDLVCMHIYHSIGRVKAGEICLFVFVSSSHRDPCYEASKFIVEQIKTHAPIFGKELFEDDSFKWKENK